MMQRSHLSEAHERDEIHGAAKGGCAGIKGMILHRNSWQDLNGAAHRKNFDTPESVLPRNFGSCLWFVVFGSLLRTLSNFRP